MKTILLSSLAKVFPDEICGDYKIDEISCLKNEHTCFQIAVMPETDTHIEVDFSDYTNVLTAFCVKSVPARFTAPEDHDDYFLKNAESRDYPDILMPFSNKAVFQGNKWSSLWFEFVPDESIGTELKNIVITLTAEGKTEQVSIKVKIIDKAFPKQSLFCTHWFHSDCLAEYYKVDVFSDEYWRITENFMKAAAQHGINLILTPLFTPPLDTEVGGERPTVQLVDVKVNRNGTYTFGFQKLKKWIDVARRSGIEYFEMSHLFTQWGALHTPKIIAETENRTRKIFGWETKASGKEYTSFLRQLAPELIKFIDENSIRDKCVFHTSDEPGIRNFYSYMKAARITKKLFGEFKIIDALSEFKFVKYKIIKNPITNIDNIDTFFGKVPELWTYYCCGPYKNYNPNRFNAMPSVRNRILGILMYKYDVKGFLQWGYNFYFTQYSKRLVDPFTETDAGGAFASGDAFVVYPAPDGTAYISLRLKVFYDAIQDYEALKMLEREMSREKIISMLENGLNEPLTAGTYPHSEEWLIKKRLEINNLLDDM